MMVHFLAATSVIAVVRRRSPNNLNPYEPSTIADAANVLPPPVQHCCPICDTPQVRRWRYLKPWTRCAACRTPLGIKGPLWLPLLFLAVGALLLFVGYRWLATNPIWIRDYVYLLYCVLALPLALHASLIALIAKYGRLVPTRGWFSASETEKIEMRIAYMSKHKRGEPCDEPKSR